MGTKIKTNFNLEIDNLKNNLNLRSNSLQKYSNPLIENPKNDELEKASSLINNIEINEKINTITKEENLANDDLIVRLKDLEKIVTQNLLKNSSNKNTYTNRNLMKKENGNNKADESENLVMDFFQNIYINEFLSVTSDKRQYLEDHNVFVFYNSLSLVMLSMLGGGVLGMLFILFFSYKDENHKMLR